MATYSSETSVHFQHTIRHYIPEDVILHNSSTSIYVQWGPTESTGSYVASMPSLPPRLTDRRKCALVECEFAVETEVPRKYLLQCQIVHHKSYLN